MLSYTTYKVIHLLGVFMALLPLGGMLLHVINGGTREYPSRRFAALYHGIGLFLALLGGFGLLARLGITGGLPGWIHVKLAIWLSLGVLPFFIYRKRTLVKPLWVATLLLAIAAASMAIYKPF